MSRVHILVDSSTKGSKNSKYGESTAFWAVFLGESSKMPSQVGMIYRNREGPNKMFYIGVIYALEDFIHAHFNKCDVEVRGDCLPVINQLCKKWSVNELKPFYDLVKNLEKQLVEEKQCKIKYGHISDDDSLYYKIDQCAKGIFELLKKNGLR